MYNYNKVNKNKEMCQRMSCLYRSMKYLFDP